MGAAGACGGGGGGVELHPTNQSAMAQAAKLALLPSLGDAKRATEGCLINGVILKKTFQTMGGILSLYSVV